jgi:hypothetical protein
MQDTIETIQSLHAFWIFYMIGGTIGGVINLRFMLPVAFNDIGWAWVGFFDIIKAIIYQSIRLLLLTCAVFFVSWIYIGYFILYYDDCTNHHERMKL